MPNNVRNRLTIKGDKITLSRILAEMQSVTEDRKGNKQPYWFDFDRLIPMPDQLKDIQTGTTTIDGKQYRQWQRVGGEDVGLGEADLKALIKAYGAADWYQWAVNNWGTKWNSYGQEEPRLTARALHYSFETAWGDPRPVIEKLAEKYNVTVVVRCSGEVDEPYTYTVTPGSKS